MSKQTLHIIFSLIVISPFLILAIWSYPAKTEALSIFSPFGGKTISWIPEAPGCAPITAAAVAVGVALTIEELIVGPPKGGTFGIVRINGVIPPVLTKVYSNKIYETPNTWVLGNYLNLCNVCGLVEDIPVVKEICKIPGLKDVLESDLFAEACGLVGEGCPINKVIHKIGTGGIGF